MRELNLRVHGIYDSKTFNFLAQDLKTKHFGFDFRPLSLNFLQQHVFLELIKNSFQPDHHYYLQYASEPDFVTQKMLADMSEYFGKKAVLRSFSLEFSDEKSLSFYTQFGMPFYWHFNTDFEFLTSLQAHPLFKGLVLTRGTLEDLQRRAQTERLLERLETWPKDLEIIVNLEWENDSISSLVELLNLSLVSLPINNSIETCYRRVDFQKLNSHLEVLRHRIGFDCIRSC